MDAIYLFSTILVLVCSCFAINAQGEEDIFERHSNLGPKSYFDVISDASMKAKHVNDVIDQETLQLADTFTGNLFDIFQYFYHRRRDLERRKYSSENDEVFGNKIPFINNGKTDNNDPYADNAGFILAQDVLEKLQDVYDSEEGSNITSTCINDTGRLIVSLVKGESWAYQFLDATGKPGPALIKKHLNFVGNYDQCRSAVAPAEKQNDTSEDSSFWNRTLHQGFDGNYCVVEMYLGTTFFMPQIGVCLPSTCSSKQVAILMNQLWNNTKIPILAECRTAPTKVTTATVFAILIIVTVGIMMILGTSYDFFMMSKADEPQQPELPVNSKAAEEIISHNGLGNGASHAPKDITLVNSENTPLLINSKSDRKSSRITSANSSPWTKVLLAFSVYSNGKKLLNTSQTTGTLGAIHGIRFLSMSWVVLCHTYLKVMTNTENSIDGVPLMLKRWTFLPIANGFVSVDTFFTLSGLLTSYLTIKEMTRKKSWKINWPMFYFHRFWRLTPPYMFAVVIALGLTQYLGEGPMWPNEQPADKTFCEDNWWTNLLYVNNLVNPEKMCFGHSWYLANDMQFFVLSPLMLVPFYFNRFAGMVSCLTFLFITTVTTAGLSAVAPWPTTLLTAHPNTNLASAGWFIDYYIKPWCRMGPFIVGILAGYILAQTNGKPFRMPRLVAVAGWLVAFVAGLACVYGIQGDVSSESVSSTGAAALYNSAARSVWGVCISWVIIACSAGYGGPIHTLLSWSPFVFLGRLTYMSYLIHFPMLAVFFESVGALLYINDTIMVIIYLGLLLFVNMTAFVFVLALESPMLGLEKAFIKRRS